MSNRRQRQRKPADDSPAAEEVPEKHTDPQPSTNPTTAAAKKAQKDTLESQLAALLALKDQTSPAQGPTGSNSTVPPLDESEQFRQQAHALLAEKGEAAVQERLKQEIQKTKKLEADIAIMKKKADACSREKDAKAVEIAKMSVNKETLHRTCLSLIDKNEELDRQLKTREEEDEKRREEIRKNFFGDVTELEKKITDQQAQKEKMEAENVELAAEFDALKAEFDKSFQDNMDEWKEQEASTSKLVSEVQEALTERDLLQRLVAARNEELHQLTDANVSLSGQIDLYKSRFHELEDVVGKSRNVYDITKNQKEQLQARLDEFENAKKSDVEKKKELDAEAAKLRTQAQTLKKKIYQLEKTKTQAEAKCRDAQTKVKAKREKENIVQKPAAKA